MWASWRCASFMCLGEQAASAAPGAESPRLVLQADLVGAGAHRAAPAPPSAAVQGAKGAAAAHPPAQDGASTASAALRKAWPPSMREVGAQAGRRAVLGSARRTCRHVRYVPGKLLLVCGARRRSFVRVGAPAVSEKRAVEEGSEGRQQQRLIKDWSILGSHASTMPRPSSVPRSAACTRQKDTETTSIAAAEISARRGAGRADQVCAATAQRAQSRPSAPACRRAPHPGRRRRRG